MKNINLILVLSFFLVASCTEDELAFDVVESPVLALFKMTSESADANLVVEATFYELDKTGILDQNVGIDSTVLSDLSIQVFANESTELAGLSTNTEGVATFEYAKSDMVGISRLEWVGNHNDTPFRIYFNF